MPWQSLLAPARAPAQHKHHKPVGCRELFFQGIDVIEAEAARVAKAKKRGEKIKLEPLPHVELEDTEIIPVNDKRLHGRSQRRNKAQVIVFLC